MFCGKLRPMLKFSFLRKYCARRQAQKVRITSRIQEWSDNKVRWSDDNVYQNVYLESDAKDYYLIRLNALEDVLLTLKKCLFNVRKMFF